jgi:hypothetical protein
MDYTGLGRIQITILHLLKDEQLQRSVIFQEVRELCYKNYYPRGVRKCHSRASIKGAIKSLKKRKLIEEHYSILGRTGKKLKG